MSRFMHVRLESKATSMERSYGRVIEERFQKAPIDFCIYEQRSAGYITIYKSRDVPTKNANAIPTHKFNPPDKRNSSKFVSSNHYRRHSEDILLSAFPSSFQIRFFNDADLLACEVFVTVGVCAFVLGPPHKSPY
jgi:hypothetical protein